MSDEMTPVRTIAARVEELRKRKGWNPAELGAELKSVGIRWDRFTVRNLENGKRQNVTVDELLALSRVLDVAPVHLLVPLESETPYQVTPGGEGPRGEKAPPEVRDAERVRMWVRGEAPLPSTDLRTFRTEVPLNELRPQGQVTHEYIKSQLEEAREQGRPSMAEENERGDGS